MRRRIQSTATPASTASAAPITGLEPTGSRRPEASAGSGCAEVVAVESRAALLRDV